MGGRQPDPDDGAPVTPPPAARVAVGKVTAECPVDGWFDQSPSDESRLVLRPRLT